MRRPCNQSLEPGSMMAVGSGQAKILINNLDLRFGPPHLARPIDQLVLPVCALLIVLDLFGRGLADIDNRLQAQMTRFDLGRQGHGVSSFPGRPGLAAVGAADRPTERSWGRGSPAETCSRASGSGRL